MLPVILALLSAAPQPEQVVSRLFAATSEGPYITYSWGEHWVRLRGDLRGFEGNIATFACLGPLVFAGGSDGVFLSDDFGENYRRIERFPGRDVTLFLTARLFALEPTLFAGTTSGLYRSTDGGNRWTQVGAGAIGAAVRAAAWPGPELFVATDEGLVVSKDKGETWDRTDGGLPTVPFLSMVISRYFPADPKVIIGTRGAGLYRSDDGGARFQSVGGPQMHSATIHALFWWDSLLLVGTEDGLWLSNDAGDTLRVAKDLSGHAVYAISVPVEDAPRSDIIVGTERGVFKSSDGGESFQLVKEGIGQPRVLELSTFPSPVQSRELPR